MKIIGSVLVLTLLATSAATQTLELTLGRDRGQERSFDERGSRHELDRDRTVVRRNQSDALETGGVNCQTATVRRMNDDGDVVTKHVRKCD